MIETNRSRVEHYFEQATAPDREGYFALFTPDAVVEDEGREHHGDAEIRAWRGEIPRVRYDVRDLQTGDDGDVRVVARISGEFPGSPVDLTFAFGFADDGRIRSLVVRP